MSDLRGLYQTGSGGWLWQRMRNGKVLRVSLGADRTIAEHITLELNRMFDDGATIEELRNYVAERMYDPLRGLSKTGKGGWRWQCMRNGKKVTVSLGADRTIAEQIVPELNRMFDAGATVEELRNYVAEQMRNPLTGLYPVQAGRCDWRWGRKRNGKVLRVSLGTDGTIAEHITLELNRMFDDGATIEELRNYAAGQIAKATAPKRETQQHGGIVPHYDWL